MQRIIFVSNRLPVTVEKKSELITFKPSIGGLATGLSSVQIEGRRRWIGWNGIPSDNLLDSDKERIVDVLNKDYDSGSVFLSSKDIKLYYHGFCNNTIWPLFHYFQNHAVYENELWDAYKHVNDLYCQTIIETCDPDDIIWIHDYQLLPLPMLIRKELPDIRIGFFLHIPFPSFEIFRQLPWRRTILQGMLGADLIGFHTYDYVKHFLDSVRNLLGHETSSGTVYLENRVVTAEHFPMGIDFKRFNNGIELPGVRKEAETLKEKLPDRKIILSVDRLDYTKGILNRLEAFDLFLDENPKYKSKVTLIVIAAPSRTGVEQYRELKQQVDERIGRINGKHGSIGWIPVWYLYRSHKFESLVAMYNIADIALVTPLRDGMNLIAKEYIASRRDGGGVLILSEMAGASKELCEAIIVNPNNIAGVKDAIKQAFEMPVDEIKSRSETMRKRLSRYDVNRWAKDFLERLGDVRIEQQKLFSKKVTKQVQDKIIQDYKAASNRLLLLDYDGTLVPFADSPEKAVPDESIIQTLKELSLDKKNELVIISGRDKESLDKYFSDLDIGLVAVHGGWVKARSQDWTLSERRRDDWKENFRDILELYVDRTPGALLEEKEFSLVFHYRRTDRDLADQRVPELKEALRDLSVNLEVSILEGNKVVEIKNAGINKGKAALRWLSNNNYDFILAMGDDETDEDTFDVLPEYAYTFKVGLKLSKAKYSLVSVSEVRQLLNELTGG